jgi:FG-GAP-like repeat
MARFRSNVHARTWLAGATLTLALACGRASAPAPAVADAALVDATNRAVGLMGRYDFDGAAGIFEELTRRYPQSGETAVNLAVALINRQQPADAADAERRLRAVLSHPTAGRRATYALGLLLLYQGKDADAAPLLVAVANASPDDPYAAYFSGQARLTASPAEALTWFDRAATLDPLLRSASYGSFQALQRLGRTAEADARLEAFQATERDPRARMAEFKYTRMGPLAEAAVVDAPPAASARQPEGPPFAAPTAVHPHPTPSNRSASVVSLADIDGDGALDLFATGLGAAPASHLVLLRRGSAWYPDPSHPLARVPDISAALWGDVDNDGLVDAVLLGGAGRTAYWRQTARGAWRDMTAASRLATRGIDAVDGALFDADHDGDLDLWLVNARGPNALFNNNGNGTFRDIAVQAGVAGDGRPSVGLAVVDLDNDRDHDLVVLKASPPHDVYLNDRVWSYRRAPGVDAFAAASATAVVGGDLDANGRPELYTTGALGLQQWTSDGSGQLRARTLAPPVEGAVGGGGATDRARPTLAVADTTGDGTLDLVASTAGGWTAFSVQPDGTATPVFEGGSGAATWTLAQLDPARGPSVVGVTAEGLVEWPPGPGRWPFMAVTVTGRSTSSDQRRSNVSGIGTKVSARTGSRWTAFDTVRMQSGRGQSLQPVAVGLGGAGRADLVSLVWSDGILQSEIGLEGGKLHVIEETQRQLSSCPVLFAFDGTRTRFVSDILGVGGIGFFERPGVYSAPFPDESFLMPDGSLGAVDGRYRIVVGEPMEEVAYFDRFALTTYDLPPGWQMALDERKAIASAAPTGRPIFYREERRPTSAVNDRNEDVTALVGAADLKAPPTGTPDVRFIGLTARHSVTLTFDRDLERGPGRPVLVVDGWLEYPYAQTVFAAWQAGAAYEAPTLEARDRRGRWHVVAKEFGYPAGMPRRMALPLDSLPAGTVALRLTTTQEIYWDRVSVAYEEPLPSAVVTSLPMSGATLREAGFARRTTGPQRTPDYDYDRRAPLWDTKYPRGWYTRFGDVAPLLADADDATVVLGPGEEVVVDFTAPSSPPRAGWTRRVVLRGRGWCKDMDLYTKDGDTVEPLPGKASPARSRLHAQFNTRYESGS